MARLARVVVTQEPHHVIHRGVRRQQVFFEPEDKKKYLDILNLQTKLFEMEVWAYCLMDNHVHLIVVPKTEESLSQAIGETHKLYTRMINFRQKCRGHLWEGRYKSTVMEERYLYAAVRYVERNPVRAGLVGRAEEYPWSSARAHVDNTHDKILSHFYLQDEIQDWSMYLSREKEEDLKLLRRHSASGRPIGSKEYMQGLETRLGRVLLKRKPGPIQK